MKHPQDSSHSASRPDSDETAGFRLRQSQNDFLSTVSHEFRTPLTSIKGFADTLLKHGDQLSREQKTQFLTIIKAQADRLIRLTENILTVSKLGAEKQQFSFRPVDLALVVERVVASVQAKTTSQREITVAIPPGLPPVWADVDALEQVLMNLVDNAVKYSQPPNPIRVRGSLPPDDTTQILIDITDQGVGIAADQQTKLFTRFHRIESPLTQSVDGTGLGLYITRSLTEAMGGQITLQSQPGAGSTFSLRFPAASPEHQAAHRRRLQGGETAS
ncbi:MAG: sensor histidine kinase [Candidatus Melainabacteria bacterium]